MTDQNPQTPAQQPAADPNAPVVTPQAVYLKDASFESPNGPFGQYEGQPAVGLNLSTRASALAQDLHEIVVQVNPEAKVGDRTVWLLEIQQAGAFLIRNLSAPDLAQVVSIMGPNYLLSYARAAVADLVTKGGFPPFLLPLVTFEGLHARAAQQAAAAGQAAPTAATVN
ncbi:MAG: protein-export chaperone SecB [Steroidobacteraceae bacterium]